MKLYEKIRQDVTASEKKGFIYTKSFGSVKAFSRLKGLQDADFNKLIDELNAYLKPHKLAAFYSSKAKGVLFCDSKHYSTSGKSKPKKPAEKLEL